MKSTLFLAEQSKLFTGVVKHFYQYNLIGTSLVLARLGSAYDFIRGLYFESII